MRAFARLLDRLSLTASRNAKLTLVRDYLAATPDPDRGWALAALTGELAFNAAKPVFIRRAVEARMDPVLFRWSYDYVGDLAETVSLVWPATPGANREPELSEVVEALRSASRAEVQSLIERWLDALEVEGRWALLKLVTGALRVGVSARLAKQACADLGQVAVTEVEEVWHAVPPPYEDLFAWLEGRSERPSPDTPGRFRSPMLAQAIDEAVDFARLDAADYAAEWKWDGIRVQAVCERGEKRLYTRTGDDISHTFPDVLAAMTYEGALDGELLVMRGGAVAPFGDLQQRLNRKTVDAKLIAAHPAGVRAYDLLLDGEEDLRALPFVERRARLEAFVARAASPTIDLSPLQPFETWEALAALRAAPPPGDPAVAEGLMLKRWDSPYLAGRPKGPWFKWKRDPHLIDAVLMYAQRGSGKRSSFYSDYTFGVWQEDEAGERRLTPVGKAYFGFTDEELKLLDKFVRDHTVERYGPVRAVRADHDFGLVLEVAFEGLQRSTRHKSGVAMRFPRISRIRWDKPAREADELSTLERMLDPEGRRPGSPHRTPLERRADIAINVAPDTKSPRSWRMTQTPSPETSPPKTPGVPRSKRSKKRRESSSYAKRVEGLVRRRVSIYIMAATVFVLGFMVLYQAWTDYDANVYTYLGLSVVDDRNSVLYAIGYPQAVRESAQSPWVPTSLSSKDGVVPGSVIPVVDGKSLFDYQMWAYTQPQDGEGQITFNPQTGIVTRIACFQLQARAGACPPKLGVQVGDTEDVPYRKAGDPDREKISGMSRLLYYDKVGVQYSMAQRRVYRIDMVARTGGLGTYWTHFVRKIVY